MAQYQVGKVAVTNKSPVVVGTGTAWASNVAAGNLFSLFGAGIWYTVKSVDSDTQITLATNYAGATAAAQAYAVQRDFTPNNAYPIPAYGDNGTAGLIAQTLLQIDSGLAAISPLAATLEGDVTLQGALMINGVDLSLSVDNGSYKLALETWHPGACQAIFETQVAIDEGSPSRIAWYAARSRSGGLVDGLVAAWMKPALSYSDAQVAAQILLLRASAATLTT